MGTQCPPEGKLDKASSHRPHRACRVAINFSQSFLQITVQGQGSIERSTVVHCTVHTLYTLSSVGGAGYTCGAAAPQASNFSKPTQSSGSRPAATAAAARAPPARK
eukprot:scaffold251_cov134-Isochrysis_galbana.AAC.3